MAACRWRVRRARARSPRRSGSPGSRWPTRSRSTRTSGCTSRWTAACCCTATTAIARTTFAYTGDYARSLTADPVEGFAFFEESIELSRRFRALKLWLSLRYHGLGAFRAAIARDLEHARLLARLVEAEPALELLAPVELTAVCFRVSHGDPSSLDARNAAILQRVVRDGRVYLSNASIRGAFALRACFVNHRTTDDDVAAIVAAVLAAR